MNPQTRRLGSHVEYEARDWMYAFNVNISLSSVFDYLVGWVRKADRDDEAGVAYLLQRALGSVAAWQYQWLGPQVGFECSKFVKHFSKVLSPTIF